MVSGYDNCYDKKQQSKGLSTLSCRQATIGEIITGVFSEEVAFKQGLAYKKMAQAMICYDGSLPDGLRN